ncbi:glycosyltransferase [Flavobacteriaceae bacterium Ap0902]|nr:glycosyltransferase [Flavobacteriaceae bacterium Ap0902]
MKLSIIIPCYNAEKYIERCVNSILNQKNHSLELEIWLCNDGSKDQTLSILKRLKNKYPSPINIIDHPNQGVYKTRNKALELVTGDFIWLIDADDTVENNTLIKIEGKLSKSIDVLNLGYKVENANHTFSQILPPAIRYPTSGLEFLQHNDGRLYLWCNIYRKSFIDENRLRFLGQSMSLEDSFFNIQAFTMAKTVAAFKEIVYVYHFNENSISKKPSLENRLKQGESSVNVQLALQKYRDNFDKDSKIYQVIDTKLKHSVLGFFFSLLKEKYPIDYTKKIIKLYKQKSLYPISIDTNLNLKAKAFRILVNSKQIFLLLTQINLMRK